MHCASRACMQEDNYSGAVEPRDVGRARPHRQVSASQDEDEEGDRIWDAGQLEQLQQAGLKITISTDMDKALPTLDVVYINAIAWKGDGFESYGASFVLDRKSPLKKHAIVLHPLARGDELSTDLDETPHNWYFSQARGAVFLRMALLTCMCERIERVMDVWM